MTHTTPRLTVATAALAVCAALLAGCGGTDSDSGSGEAASTLAPAQRWNPGDGADTPTEIPTDTATATASTPPDSGFGDVNMSDAASVARKAVEVWYTWDTTVESGPNDAVANAVPLMTTDYADQLLAGTPQGGPGGTWLLWAEKKVHTTADVRDVTATGGTDAGPTQVAGDRAYLEFEVVQTPLGPTNTPVAAAVTRRVGVLCTRSDNGGWGVSAVQPL